MNEGGKLRDDRHHHAHNVVGLTDLNISIMLSGPITSRNDKKSSGQVEAMEIDVISDSCLTFNFSVLMTRILQSSRIIPARTHQLQTSYHRRQASWILIALLC